MFQRTDNDIARGPDACIRAAAWASLSMHHFAYDSYGFNPAEQVHWLLWMVLINRTLKTMQELPLPNCPFPRPFVTVILAEDLNWNTSPFTCITEVRLAHITCNEELLFIHLYMWEKSLPPLL